MNNWTIISFKVNFVEPEKKEQYEDDSTEAISLIKSSFKSSRHHRKNIKVFFPLTATRMEDQGKHAEAAVTL